MTQLANTKKVLNIVANVAASKFVADALDAMFVPDDVNDAPTAQQYGYAIGVGVTTGMVAPVIANAASQRIINPMVDKAHSKWTARKDKKSK